MKIVVLSRINLIEGGTLSIFKNYLKYVNEIIENGYSFIYTSQSRIWHSHQLTLKDTYKRYKDIGKFEKLYEKEINFSKTKNEGKILLKYLIIGLWREKNIKELIYLLFDIGIRWFGYKVGEK